MTRVQQVSTVKIFSQEDFDHFGEGVGLLLFLFAMIAVFGFVLGSLRNRKNKKKIDIDENEDSFEL